MISNQQTLFHINHTLTRGVFCIFLYLWFCVEVAVCVPPNKLVFGNLLIFQNLIP